MIGAEVVQVDPESGVQVVQGRQTGGVDDGQVRSLRGRWQQAIEGVAMLGVGGLGVHAEQAGDAPPVQPSG
jgi:hypothetical protein